MKYVTVTVDEVDIHYCVSDNIALFLLLSLSISFQEFI